MDENKAYQVIVEALNLAMTKGCFGLIENKNIVEALDVISSALTKTE